jgi:putative peptidoglycan lipid II flippase
MLSVGTLASRVLGFLRDIILAKLLGTGLVADAFFVAQKIPNLFRDLVGEGATNAAVVPILAEYNGKENKKAFWEFVNVVFILALMALSIITILGIIFAPVVVRVIAPGFMANPEKLDLAIRLTKILFPYLIFIGLTAYTMGILFTFRSFATPAFSPCLLNVAVIVSALISFKTMKEPVYGLAIGVLVGGVLQLLVQIKPIFEHGFTWIRPKTLAHPGALKIGKLLIPRLLGSGVYQLTVFIDTFCASLSSIVGPGGISAIYYANRIIQFPMGVFSVALASAVLPSISGLANKNDVDAIKKMVVFSLENIFFIMCPITVILLVFSMPITRVLFQRGEFDLYSTQITSDVVAYLAIGLFSFGSIKILVTVFHALQDTKTPVKVAALCLLINASLNFILMYPLKVGGIALASAIAGTLDFLMLFYILNKRLGGLNSGLLGYFCKVTLASVVAGALQFIVWYYWAFPNDVIKLCVVVSAGLIFYEVFCLFLKIEQAQSLLRWLKALIKVYGPSNGYSQKS